MKSEIVKQDKNVVELSIEVPAKDAQQAYDRAVKHVSQYVNIAGFRKGKAPKNMVEKHVGVEQIKHEALEKLLPNVLHQAISEKELDVIAQPTVEKYDYDLGKDLKITATVEVRPEVKLGKYKDLKLKTQGYEIPSDAFDKALENLLVQNSKLENVTDRKSKETDIIVFDFDGYCNGEPIVGGKADKYSLDLANSNFIPGYAEQLVGHDVGEEFEVKVNFPDEYHEPKLAGQPAIFKIKMHEIKEKVMPELNDEFAKKVGNFETVQALKDDINQYLEKTKENEDKKLMYNTILEEVVSKSTVEIPESMIEREAKSLMEEYKQRLAMQGFSYEQAIEAQGKETVEKSLKEDAVFRIKNSLVLDQIAKNEELKLEASDMEEKLKQLEASYRMDRNELMKQMAQSPEMINMISQQAINDKVVALLKEANTVELSEAKKSTASKKETKSTTKTK